MRNRTGNGSIVSLTLIVALATVCGGLGQRTEAQCETKILALDGEEFDGFGDSVSIDGDVMVVGSDGDDDNGDRAGAAYVYRFDGAEWLLETKLLASDGMENDFFGSDVSLDGDVMVIGAAEFDYNEGGPGSAYVFRYNGSDWIEEAKLLASDGDYLDYFGMVVSMKDDVIVIGARNEDENGLSAGAAYVFRYDGSEWVEETKLLAAHGYKSDNFGYSVSTDGDLIAVGANRYRYGDDCCMGAAYVFRYDGSEWIEETKLLASDGERGDRFGAAVAIENDVVIVGATNDHHDAVEDAGAAYMYRYDGSDWIEEAKLVASDGVEDDFFGYALSLDGDTVAIGAYAYWWNGGEPGWVYLFEYMDSQWHETTKLMASDGQIRDHFGCSVSLDGETLAVGASGNDDYGDYSGSVYVLDLGCDPAPTLGVSPNPLIAREDVTFTGTHLNAAEETYLAYTLDGLGSTFVPQLNITLDLGGAVQGRSLGIADSWGYASVDIFVPRDASGRDIWFQACQYELTTNVVATSIE